MHVLMLSDVFFPRINGVSTSIETFRRDLAAQGIDISLIAPAYPHPHGDDSIVRIPARRVVFDPEDRLMQWRPLKRAIGEVASRRPVDLIHIQTPFAAHVAGSRSAKTLGVPVVTTYHTHFEEYIQHYLPLLPRPWLRAAARQVARSQCNDLDAVIVPSRAMHDTLTGYGVTAPLHILPTGIPVGQFAGGRRDAFRSAQGIAPDRPVALFVGRVAHEKNIGFLLDAIDHGRRLLPELLLIVAGEGPALPALKRQCTRLGLDDHVRFVGYLDRAQALPDCYAAADVFAFASRTETQGLVLLEALAAGLPVYALPAMGAADIVGPEEGAVAAPDDPVAFGTGLTALLNDAPRRAHLAREGQAFAARWSGPGRARQLGDLYRTLIT